MEHNYLDQMLSCTVDDMPSLNVAALAALELIASTDIPTISHTHSRPLVAGSEGAMATARVLFADGDAVFASESTYQEKLETISAIDGVILVSSSGGKHAPHIAQYAKEKGKQVTLLTNTEDAPAAAFADTIAVFPRNREPYAYNTSTYLSMVLSRTQEDAQKIRSHIIDVVAPLTADIQKYDSYCLIIPPRLEAVGSLIKIKFDELFGPTVQGRVFTTEAIKHAKTVVPGKELFISFGEENTTWGASDMRAHISLPDTASYGALMAISYYIVGCIQDVHPPYFKDNIVTYTEKVSDIFGHTIKPIVE